MRRCVVGGVARRTEYWIAMPTDARIVPLRRGFAVRYSSTQTARGEIEMQQM